MQILIYGINYSPEPTGIGKYTGQMAAWLSERGLNVRESLLGRLRGPLFGEEKRNLIDTAWVLAAPSHSEVVGLVNLLSFPRSSVVMQPETLQRRNH